MTRCRVGDLAVIIRCGRDYQGANVGVLVEVVRVYVRDEVLRGHTRPYRHDSDDLTWVVQTRGTPLLVNPARLFFSDLHACYDTSLLPIRDPGEDAVDEMVQLLGKPESIPA